MNYTEVILTPETQSSIVEKLTAFLKKGICLIEFSHGNFDPFKKKTFKFRELYNEGHAIAINVSGAWKGDKPYLARIPMAAPDDGRHFHEGAHFFFPQNEDAEILMKSPVQQFKLGTKGLVQTYEVMKVTLLFKSNAKLNGSDRKKYLRLRASCDAQIKHSLEVDSLSFEF